MENNIADIREKLGALDAKVSAAHKRVDRLEELIRDDLKDIKTEVHQLTGYMNRGKGWAAATMFIAGAIGAGVMKLLGLIKGL